MAETLQPRQSEVQKLKGYAENIPWHGAEPTGEQLEAIRMEAAARVLEVPREDVLLMNGARRFMRLQCAVVWRDLAQQAQRAAAKSSLDMIDGMSADFGERSVFWSPDDAERTWVQCVLECAADYDMDSLRVAQAIDTVTTYPPHQFDQSIVAISDRRFRAVAEAYAEIDEHFPLSTAAAAKDWQ